MINCVEYSKRKVEKHENKGESVMKRREVRRKEGKEKRKNREGMNEGMKSK